MPTNIIRINLEIVSLDSGELVSNAGVECGDYNIQLALNEHVREFVAKINELQEKDPVLQAAIAKHHEFVAEQKRQTEESLKQLAEQKGG